LNHSTETINLSNFLRRYWPIVILTTIISILVPVFYSLENWVLLLGPPLFLVFLFALLNFKLTLYLLISSMFLGAVLIYQGHINLSSVFLGVLLLSYLAKGLVSGEISISKTPLDKVILIFMVAIAFSLINVRYLYVGVWTYLWHVCIFVLFYVVASSVESSSLKNLFSFLIISAVLYSIPSLIESISSSGAGRALGIGGTYATNIINICFLFCLSFFFFEERSKRRILWGIALLILLASCLVHKIRGAVIGLGLSYVFMSMMVFRKSTNEGLKFVRRNLIISSVAITIAVILVFYTLSTLSEGFVHHLPYSRFPIDTIQIRFILWDLALKFFFQNPVIGIGLGQFSKLSTIGIEPKYQMFYFYISNIGTHNLLLSYLSETGVIGAICFLFFLYSSLRLAWLKFKLSTTVSDLKLSGALLGGLFYIVITSLYAGAWTTNILGMMFALILAWTVIFSPTRQRENNIRITRLDKVFD